MWNLVARNYIGQICGWNSASNATIFMNKIQKNKNKNPPARIPLFFIKDDKLMFFFHWPYRYTQ